MPLAPLAGLALIIGVAAIPGIDLDHPTLNLSMQEKNAAMEPIVRSATDCITRTIASDPRLRKQDLGDLIVDSITSCMAPVRTMIDAYDRYFGQGTGEAFFMGPYLEALPTIVAQRTKGPVEAR